MKKSLLAFVSACLFGSAPLLAQAEKIGMETASAQSVVGIMPQTMAANWAKVGIDVQLAMGQTLTKSLLKIAQGQLDTAVVPTPSYVNLAAGKGPYAQLGDKAKALAPNVRALWGFPASFYHAIVWADSGINSWADAKGKRVFIGPPAGAANAQITALAKAGGLAPGDYTPIKAPWGTATQNFQDGQFDVYVGSFGLGSQMLAELSVTRKIRFLPVPGPAPAALGLTSATIPKGAYPGQVNKDDTPTWQTTMMVMARTSMAEDTAYKLTKAYFESVPAMARSNALLAHLNRADPFVGVSAPVHPGAVRYYNEAGIKVPDNLLAK